MSLLHHARPRLVLNVKTSDSHLFPETNCGTITSPGDLPQMLFFKLAELRFGVVTQHL